MSKNVNKRLKVCTLVFLSTQSYNFAYTIQSAFIRATSGSAFFFFWKNPRFKKLLKFNNVLIVFNIFNIYLYFIIAKQW